jgi:hypothetical protein
MMILCLMSDLQAYNRLGEPLLVDPLFDPGQDRGLDSSHPGIEASAPPVLEGSVQ